MKAEKQYYYTTAAHEKLPDDERAHGPADDVEPYHYGNLTLHITTDEREEFEDDTGMTLDSDVLNSAQFDKLMAEVQFEDHEKISIAMAQCVAAFGDFDDLPDELDTLCRIGTLTCTSYENDNCPSFMVPGFVPVQDAQMLFVEYLDEAFRGRAYRAPGDPVPKRYTVITCGSDDAHYHGDDLQTALFHLFLKKNVERVALVFVTDLLRRVGAEKMRTIAKRNRAQQNPSICHTHDFVDANVFMDDAIKVVYGKSATDTGGDDVGIMSDDMHHVWDLAWRKAKEMINERFPAS